VGNATRLRVTRTLWVLLGALWLSASVVLRAQTLVTLSPAVAPTAGQAGVTSVTITGSNFPAGTIAPSAVTITLQPVVAGSGPSASTSATTVATVIGTTRRVTFQLPGSLTVAVATSYRIALEGTTSAGVRFVSASPVSITVNPPAVLLSVSPSSARLGDTLDVSITGQFTNYVQDATQASFGAGMSVGSGTEAGFGPVTVTSPTTATAHVTVGASAAVGARTVTVRTGAQQATLVGGFTVNDRPSGAPPVITISLNPAANASGWHNTAVTAHFTCTQDGMPLAGCPADEVITTEGSNQTITRSVTNAAGQTASVTSEPFNIDLTPPAIALSTPTTGTTVFTPSVTLTGLLTDAVSGVESASCSGAPATLTVGAFSCEVTFTPGANTAQATAIDRAGNPASSSLVFIYNVVPLISITQPANLSYTSISPTTVGGTVNDPTATVVVNSVPATVVNGAFSVALPLAEGPNIVTATATSASGAAGTATLWVTLDTTPPRVTVTSPTGGFVTADAAIAVSGIINDLVAGTVNPEQAAVTVNGVPAQVANRMFLAQSVALALGPNLIQVVGRDRVGNQGTTEITVTRTAPDSLPRIKAVSGSGQTGTIRSLLPVPLTVSLTDAAGNPAAGKPVIFKVTGNDGLVGSGGAAAPTVIATTNAEGRAEANWTLGGRAGAGGNTVEAYSVGYEGTAVFIATGNQGAAGKIVIDTGNNQYGPIGQRLPRPLVAVVVDDGNNRLAGVPVTFTVSAGGGNLDGQETASVVSDPDGRVAATLTLGMQEGESNNVVSATFESNTGFVATFNASGRFPGDPAKTSISGVVLDNTNIPIPGVSVRAVNTEVLHANGNAANGVLPVQTDAQGQFTISQAPVGFTKLLVDGSTATRPGSYPTLDYDVVTVAGQKTTVGQPIYLLPLETANSLCVTDTTGGGTLTVPQAPGFSLTFGPGQVTFPGGSKTGCVSVTVVHPDKVPMMPGFGQQPRFIVTIQPAGAMFNPPAPITLPNVDGLKPREVTEMYSFDHDIGSFVAIGTGTVSADGQVIRSNNGVGVLKAGWHCGGNPNTSGAAASCPICFFCPGSLSECQPQGNGTPCGNGGTCQFGRGCVGGGGECPEGYVRNADGQCCMGDTCTDPECPPGQTYDPVARVCVNSGPCTPGFTLTNGQCCSGSTCVPPECPIGTVFDPITQQCVDSGPCEPGFTLNAEGQCCQGTMCVPPMCPAGQVVDPITGQCVDPPCPPGCSACTTTPTGQQCTVCSNGQPPVNGQCSDVCSNGVQLNAPTNNRIEILSTGALSSRLSASPANAEYTWTIRVTDNSFGLGCFITCNQTTESGEWQFQFGGGSASCSSNVPGLAILGGNAEVTAGACSEQKSISFDLRMAQNPSTAEVRSAIGAAAAASPFTSGSVSYALNARALKRMACYETSNNPSVGGQSQFTIDGRPFIDTGGVGIFQITNPAPTCSDLWDWRANVNHGVAIFRDKMRDALQMSQDKLTEINGLRKAAGLSACNASDVLLSNDKSDIVTGELTVGQLDREAIRRFNGGREHVWVPDNGDAKSCTGTWQISTNSNNPTYVSRVLTLSATFGGACSDQ